jgi:hypothetical protein
MKIPYPGMPEGLPEEYVPFKNINDPNEYQGNIHRKMIFNELYRTAAGMWVNILPSGKVGERLNLGSDGELGTNRAQIAQAYVDDRINGLVVCSLYDKLNPVIKGQGLKTFIAGLSYKPRSLDSGVNLIYGGNGGRELPEGEDWGSLLRIARHLQAQDARPEEEKAAPSQRVDLDKLLAEIEEILG